MRRFDDDAQAAQEVLNGNAHAVLSSYPKPTQWEYQYPKVMFLPTRENLTQGDEAFALRKGDPDAPLSDTELEAKFLELCEPVLGTSGAHGLLETLWHIEKLSDVRVIPCAVG